MTIARDAPMDAHLKEGTTREHFLADHRRLDAVFVRLLDAFAADDRLAIDELWTEFETGILRHMEEEEAHLIPILLRTRERDARAFMLEHKHIRNRLAELGTSLELHTVRLDVARAFIDELRAHAAHEDATLYRIESPSAE